jgi:hypothetical protein
VGGSGSGGRARSACIRPRRPDGRRCAHCGPGLESRGAARGVRSAGPGRRRSTRRYPPGGAGLGTSDTRSIAGRAVCPRWFGSRALEPGRAAGTSVGLACAVAARCPGYSAPGASSAAAGDNRGAARTTAAVVWATPAAAWPAHLAGPAGLVPSDRPAPRARGAGPGCAVGYPQPAPVRSAPGVCPAPAARAASGVRGTCRALRAPGTDPAAGPLRTPGGPRAPYAPAVRRSVAAVHAGSTFARCGRGPAHALTRRPPGARAGVAGMARHGHTGGRPLRHLGSPGLLQPGGRRRR